MRSFARGHLIIDDSEMAFRYRQGQSGFTIIEVLVASVLGLMILGIAIQSALSNQALFQTDVVRTRINQNLRSGLDIIGMNIRQAGESLPSNFPAIEIIDGGTENPDQLVLRRNLLDEVLNVCDEVEAGTSVASVYLAVDGAVSSGCMYANQGTNFQSWSNYRAAAGGSVRAYIFNPTTKNGEFFDYVGETDTGTDYFIIADDHTWSFDYAVGSGAVYILEEWRFSLENGYLRLIENGDTANPLNVVWGVTDFQVQVLLEGGAIVTQFLPTDNWSLIEALDIALSGEEAFKSQRIERTLNARFFPRNILSL